MVTPYVAAYSTSYAHRVPYLTVAEYQNDPNGIASNVLVAGQGAGVNQQVLEQTIVRASAWADSLTQQALQATSDVQSGEYRMRDGWVYQSFDYAPIVYLTQVLWGWLPSQLVALPDLSNVWPESRRVLRIPILAYTSSSQATPQVPLWPAAQYGRVLVQSTYVNGWANTLLAGAVSASATSLTVTDPTGIVPGLPMYLVDAGQGGAGGGSESFVVDASYTIGSATVPLKSGTSLAYAHQPGIPVSSLPQDVRQAVSSLTTALIKTRAADALVMASVSEEPSKSDLIEAGGITDLEVAIDLLEPYRRVW